MGGEHLHSLAKKPYFRTMIAIAIVNRYIPRPSMKMPLCNGFKKSLDFIRARKTKQETVWESLRRKFSFENFIQGERIAHSDKIDSVIVIIESRIGYVGSKYRGA